MLKYFHQTITGLAGCADLGGSYRLDFTNSTTRLATTSEIAAAQSLADADAATLAQEKLDRQELRDKFIAIRDGLNAIINTASFTNASRDAAIVELAKDVRFVLKAVKGLM